VRDLTGGSKKAVHVATEAHLRRDYPDSFWGPCRPVGGARSDPVIVDSRAAARESVVLEAARTSSRRLSYGAVTAQKP